MNRLIGMTAVSLLIAAAATAQQGERICSYTSGPRAGQTEKMRAGQNAQIGGPCHDGAGSSGVIMAEASAQAVKLSRTCRYNSGPKHGQQETFDGATPVPIGSPCTDNLGSSGVAVAVVDRTPGAAQNIAAGVAKRSGKKDATANVGAAQNVAVSAAQSAGVQVDAGPGAARQIAAASAARSAAQPPVGGSPEQVPMTSAAGQVAHPVTGVVEGVVQPVTGVVGQIVQPLTGAIAGIAQPVTGAVTGVAASACIPLDADVAAVFKDAAAVNQALRSLIAQPNQ